MIVKILSSASSNFHGVEYNDKKVNNGKGELMLMKNFPSFINKDSSKDEVKNYFKSISKNSRAKKPQFHAVISTKFKTHSKNELTQVAEEFMNRMGYKKQPYVVVFHNDTENNHVHIVSTRISVENQKKIDDSFEKLKSQKALSESLEKVLGQDDLKKIEEIFEYKFSTDNQLKLLLQRNGFDLVSNEKEFVVLKNGAELKKIDKSKDYSNRESNAERKKQIKALLYKFSEKFDNRVFKVVDNRKKEIFSDGPVKPKIEFESELQSKMKKLFGIDIVFHFKDGNKPFGYTLIDNKSKMVFKGSDIMKMNELFQFKDSHIDKKTFESINDFRFRNGREKKVLIDFLNGQRQNRIEHYMLFDSRKKVNNDIFNDIKREAEKIAQGRISEDAKLIFDTEGNAFFLHYRHHTIVDAESVMRNYNHSEIRSKDNEIIDKLLSELEKAGRYYPTKNLEDEFDLRKRKRKKR